MAVVGIDFGALCSKVPTRIPCRSSPLTPSTLFPRSVSPVERVSISSQMKLQVVLLRALSMMRSSAHFFTTHPPSLRSFATKQRAIGEPAKTQEISNFNNTILSLTPLLDQP